jgi:hypothetical protein
MTRLRDVVELKAIFGHLSTWAASEFRNGLSNYVTQWMSRFPSTSLDEDEDEEIESLTKRIGNLKISRTNSLRFGNQPSITEMTTRETSQLHLVDASNRTNSIPEAKSQQGTLGPNVSGSASKTDQEGNNKSSKDSGTHSSVRTTAISPAHGPSLATRNERIVYGGEPANANAIDVEITIDSLDDTNESNVLPTPASMSSRRGDAAEPPPHHLQAPRPSRPRGASTGSNISRDSNPVSFRLLSTETRESGTTSQGDMLQVRKPRGERPRSFDAKEFEGVKFAFDISPRRAKDDGHLNMSKKHVRVFSAHDLDGEEFTFAARPADAPSPREVLSYLRGTERVIDCRIEVLEI